MASRRRAEREEISKLAEQFSEPRRSVRQRREVYGTLNEKLMVKKGVVDKNISLNGEDEGLEVSKTSLPFLIWRMGREIGNIMKHNNY